MLGGVFPPFFSESYFSLDPNIDAGSILVGSEVQVLKPPSFAIKLYFCRLLYYPCDFLPCYLKKYTRVCVCVSILCCIPPLLPQCNVGGLCSLIGEFGVRQIT